jgi:hypothetical protein
VFREEVNMKRAIFAILFAFSATLAVIIGKRMSTDAMAVVIGVVCGVLASIPTSLLTFILASRREERGRELRRDYPPVVIINPPNNSYYQSPLLPSVYQDERALLKREFRIVGGDEVTVS